MDHTERDLHHTAERYLLNLLPPDERAAFEEHFVGCPDCIAVIERAEALQSGLADVAAEEAAKFKQPKKSLRLRFAGWYVKHSNWGQTWMLVAACALFTAGPFLFFYSRLRDANRRVDVLQAESAGWERRYLSERENADRLKRLADQVRAGQSMVTQLVAAKPAPRPAGSPVVSLEAGTMGQLDIPAGTQWVLLAVQLREPFPTSANVQLYATGAKLLAEVWGLKPNARGAIAVSVAASLFDTGWYALSIGGVNYTFYARLGTGT